MWYSVNDYSDERFECKTSHLSIEKSIDLEMAANQCAEDFHSNHDGWEASWPLNITLYESEDGPAIAKFFVERDVEPVFYARIMK